MMEYYIWQTLAKTGKIPTTARDMNVIYPKTGEMGTFIVTKNGKPNGKELFKAHHYTKEELMELIEQVKKFKVETVHETIFTTFQGNQTKGYIIIAKKI